LLDHPEIQKALVGIEKIQIDPDSALPVCWITDVTILPDEKKKLIEAGFQIVPVLDYKTPDTQDLWCR
jgi:hypothetical protein